MSEVISEGLDVGLYNKIFPGYCENVLLNLAITGTSAGQIPILMPNF